MDIDAFAVVQVDGDRVADRLRKALAEAGLRDPAVTIRLVDHLERILDTGKLRRFLPPAVMYHWVRVDGRSGGRSSRNANRSVIARPPAI